MVLPTEFVIILNMAIFVLGFTSGYFFKSAKIPKTTQTNQTRTQELKDFFKDIDTKGYSLVRVDPDEVFHVSGRKQ